MIHSAVVWCHLATAEIGVFRINILVMTLVGNDLGSAIFILVLSVLTEYTL
jgi:hypothetical protein